MSGGRHAAGRSAMEILTSVLVVAATALLTYGVGKAIRSTASSGPTTTTATTQPTTVPTFLTTTTTTTTTATTTTVPIRAPSEIKVMVFNGEGTKGLGGQVTDLLTGLGYQTVTPEDYGSLIPTTKVWFADGFLTEAHQLAARFPDADVERNVNVTADFEVDVVVVLGASYRP